MKTVSVCFDWFGRFTDYRSVAPTKYLAELLGETPKRFRVRFLSAVGFNYRKDEIALVPKWAVELNNG